MVTPFWPFLPFKFKPNWAQIGGISKLSGYRELHSVESLIGLSTKGLPSFLSSKRAQFGAKFGGTYPRVQW